MPRWTQDDMPDMSGRTAIVTGSTAGIGAEAAMALAGRGAEVILAVRNPAKGARTRASILARHPGGSVEVEPIDLADLGSVRAFAARIVDGGRPIHVLLNNAGLGLLSRREVTKDGFEMQFGTNHLGHFVLTGLLLPALLRADAPRVVTISSVAHRRGRIDLDDLQAERRYGRSSTYAQSKLANLMFALTLDRRARAAESALLSVAAHPGISLTDFFHGAGRIGLRVSPANPISRRLGLDPARGALPGLYAATMPGIQGGDYVGPDGLGEIRGWPAPARISPHAHDRAIQERLWAASEALTGVDFEALRH
ncbi:oxidoreductase [Acetobacteraceae bacterium KSS8]|uniref:Oxidoreductase n=1 Tax=Endosaccharibacter trunci TaxID=2812733 RepID=A0ABT1WAU6_9PROT|nr:oxidoreductase [Acetobacteraceae bacterium KSS8]